MTDLPPFLYRTYRRNLRRATTKPRKEREPHALERIFFALPAKAYVRWHHLKHQLRPKHTKPPEAGIFEPTTMDK